MNRAQRRGNTVQARRGTSSSLRTQTASKERSGVSSDTGMYTTGEPASSGEGKNTARSSTGRFQAPAVSVALPPALTRQQRRYQERMAAKVASAWKSVTKGDGVTLLDGKEVG